MPAADTTDEVNFGTYRIRYCGDKSSLVIDLLQKLFEILDTAIEDAMSNPTSPAYNTFFKHVYYREEVLDVLTGIAFGQARPLNGSFFSPVNLNAPRSPRLMCSTELGQ